MNKNKQRVNEKMKHCETCKCKDCVIEKEAVKYVEKLKGE